MAPKITKKTCTVNTTAKLNRGTDFIVIHYSASVTSKSGTARSTAAYFAKPAAKASADFIVDDVETVQYNPDIRNRYCWHVGGGRYRTKGGSLYGTATNANCIGIEVCSTNNIGKVTNANDKHWSFTDAVLERTEELVRYLMATYNIDAAHVIRHYDVTGKPCPGIVGWNADSGSEAQWKAFKARLGGPYKVDQTVAVTTAPANETGYIVKITASALNVRSGPGTNYPIVTAVKKGEAYTIVEEKNGWGRLKSGAGWISLSYATKK